jgi:peroxiredoxin
MKFYPIILLALIYTSAAAQKEPVDQFTVKGHLTEGATVKLYLSEAKKVPEKIYLDSIVTDEAGNFSFTGQIPEPRLFILALAGSNPLMDRNTFFIEPKSVISIKGSADSLGKAEVSGSSENALAKAFALEFKKQLAKASAENSKAYMVAKDNNDSAAMITEGKIADRKNIDESAKLIAGFVSLHPSSAASIAFIEVLFKYSRTNTADSLLQMVEKTPAGKYAEAKLLRESINTRRNVMAGAVASDFSQPDTAGHLVPLSSLRGKYVLIDFWASWCVPCRQENPNILETYNKFKDKNFTVLSVSLDNNRSSWLKAINDDHMPWLQVSDLKGMGNTAAIQYGVKAIPTSFLIDPKGRIVALNLRGTNLENTLKSIIK